MHYVNCLDPCIYSCLQAYIHALAREQRYRLIFCGRLCFHRDAKMHHLESVCRKILKHAFNHLVKHICTHTHTHAHEHGYVQCHAHMHSWESMQELIVKRACEYVHAYYVSFCIQLCAQSPIVILCLLSPASRNDFIYA